MSFDPLFGLCAKLWDKINNFPTSTATSLQGWLPIFTPIMAELRQVQVMRCSCATLEVLGSWLPLLVSLWMRQFSGVAPSANPGVQTLAQCYYFSLVLPHLPVQVTILKYAIARADAV